MTRKQRRELQQKCPHANTFEGIASKWCLDCGFAAASAAFETAWRERTVVVADASQNGKTLDTQYAVLYLVAMNTTNYAERRSAGYVRSDNKVAVRGWWVYRGGSLWSGEVTVLTSNSVLRFQSTTPMTTDSLAGYASDEYMQRNAARFSVRAA